MLNPKRKPKQAYTAYDKQRNYAKEYKRKLNEKANRLNLCNKCLSNPRTDGFVTCETCRTELKNYKNRTKWITVKKE
ncbi:MAG: hypothetical protein FWG64_09100 [Firmicutes bacterium]|nr:hypothetical protein [Bacillota bacterium]